MVTYILEWEYLISSAIGLILVLILLSGVETVRRIKRQPRDVEVSIAIRKVGWRYTLIAVMFFTKTCLGIMSLLGDFGYGGIWILAIQPDILLVLVSYEWHTDRQLIKYGRYLRTIHQEQMKLRQEKKEAAKDDNT